MESVRNVGKKRGMFIMENEKSDKYTKIMPMFPNRKFRRKLKKGSKKIKKKIK